MDNPGPPAISPGLVELRAALKREGLRYAAHCRRMLRKHFPEQYGDRGRSRAQTARRALPGFIWDGERMAYSADYTIAPVNPGQVSIGHGR